jgi:hypothetical protein
MSTNRCAVLSICLLASIYFNAANAELVLYHSSPKTWADARADCARNRGDLAIFKTSQSFDSAKSYLGVSPGAVWIGATNLPCTASQAASYQASSLCPFKWVDGSIISDGYSNWDQGVRIHASCFFGQIRH